MTIIEWITMAFLMLLCVVIFVMSIRFHDRNAKMRSDTITEDFMKALDEWSL